MYGKYLRNIQIKLNNYRVHKLEKTFRKLNMDDRSWVEQACMEDGSIAGHVNFLTMLIYQELYSYDAFIRCHDCVIKRPWTEDGVLYFQFPIGAPEKRKSAVIEMVKRYAPIYPDIVFLGASEDGLHQLQKLYPDKIVAFENDRDSQNYILDVQEQINLEGSSFADRRNKIRRFNESYQWTWESVTEENIHECLKINSEWCDAYGDEVVAQRGRIEMDLIMKYYHDFDFRGELYRIDGVPVAFSMGCPFNKDTYINQMMKAKKESRDITIATLHGFMSRNCAEYTYTNYTEDMGLPGLRKFKTMLRPKFLTDFYYITLHF